MQNLRFPWPILPLSGQVIDGNSSKLLFSELKDLAGSVSVGIYDYKTNAIATGTGNGNKFFLGYSSEHTQDKLDTFLFGFKQPKGRNYWAFKGNDVLSFEYSDPTYLEHEEWAVGFSGSNGCDLRLPTFECGKIYGLRIILDGNPVLEKLGSKMNISVFTDPICCTESDCGSGCQDNRIDCSIPMKQLAERVNKHQVSAYFKLKARYITSDYSAPVVFDMKKYRITVMDDGSNFALATVQRNAPADAVVVRTGRTDWYSTYEICTAGTPTNITAQASFALPNDCDVCPAGSTTVAGSTTYQVIRPLDSDTDISDDTKKQTYADAIATDYKAEATFDGTVTGVTVGTDTIASTAHGLNTGTKVTYSNGGGTSVTGITSGNDYYVIRVNANSLKLASSYANAIAGTPIDLTVVGTGTSHTLTVVATAKFISVVGGTAIVEVTVPSTQTLAAIDADVISVSRSVGVTCSVGANTCFAADWVQIGQAYRTTRDLCITLPRIDDCSGGNRLQELVDYYTGIPGVVHTEGGAADITVSAGVGCEDTYTISQYSKGCMEDACLASDTAHFEDLGAYDNTYWKVVEEAPVEFDADRRCGIRITVEPTEEYIEACEFELGMNPTLDPITFEVSWVADSLVGDMGEVCDFKLPVAKKIKSAQHSRQQGYSLLYQYIKVSEAYEPLGGESINRVLRRKLDQNYRHQVSKHDFYRYYYLTFKVDRNNSNFDQGAEIVEAIVAIPLNRPDKMAQFEAAMLSPLSKFGVTLEKRV